MIVWQKTCKPKNWILDMYMASLISSPLYNFMLISFTFFSFFLITSHAFDGRKTIEEARYQTLEISSLLPSSVCSSSSKGPSKRPSTLKVFHRHGPCSKHNQDKATASLDVILSHDQSRVDSIQSKINSNVQMDKVKDKKTTIPAKSGVSLGVGNYIVSLGLGTPKKSLSLVFDTGSELTWTQCQPCPRTCHSQKDPIFDPSASASYSNVSCNSAQCTQLYTATGTTLGCSGKTCVYGLKYVDGSFSIGLFGQDTLTISPTDIVPNFYFGCGKINQGLFGNSAGILALGRDPLSMVSQTAQKYGKYFSYCLPAPSSSTGHLTFGKSSGVPINVKFTPFSSSRGKPFYFIDILGITVGMTQLSISPSVFKTSGTVIDSGAVITRLPPTAYRILSTEFKKQMSKYPSAPAYSIFDTCFDLRNDTKISSIPKLSFTFVGNVKVDIALSGTLVRVGVSRFCLAFAGNSNASQIAIYGNLQQTTMEVVYDVAGGKLGFGPGGC